MNLSGSRILPSVLQNQNSDLTAHRKEIQVIELVILARITVLVNNVKVMF